ncbi:MAG TPA: hypothetical protein VFA48_06570 [Gammaproteobacteria bacterium]|nr:hypothetical protein [Gammaproteobacteria bacterium]
MKPEHIRRLLAQEAARIIAEEGRHDFLGAKQKAAAHLGLALKHLPTNREIETALIEHQRLFEASSQPERMERLRSVALDVMQRLGSIETRATGAVLGEVATAHARVELHAFVEPPEYLVFQLSDMGVDYEENTRRHNWRNGRMRDVPMFAFSIEGQSVEITVFQLKELREAPMDAVDGHPMRRIGKGALEKLLANGRQRVTG